MEETVNSTHVYCVDCVHCEDLIQCMDNNLNTYPKECSQCYPYNPEDSVELKYRPNYIRTQII